MLRGAAALQAAAQSIDSTPFLIAYWAGFEGVIMGGTAADKATTCGDVRNVGDEPGVPSSALAQELDFLTTLVPGPLIVRVHTHDPRALAVCAHAMVGETVVWHGDAATDSHPWSLAQVAQAFAVPPTAVADSCLGGSFPGVDILQIPSATRSVNGIVAVFPSAAALAVAAPVAAAGETDGTPAALANSVCLYFGDSTGRWFRPHWMARGNVLAGVFYDTALQPDSDAAVISARAGLDGLP